MTELRPWQNGLLMIAFLIGADFFKWLGLPRLAFYSTIAALLTVAEMVITNAVAQGIERANKKVSQAVVAKGETQ